jgi:hypothetical protein
MRSELGREFQIMKFSESASPLARNFCTLLLPVYYAGIPLDPNFALVLQTIEHKLSLEPPK